MSCYQQQHSQVIVVVLPIKLSDLTKATAQIQRERAARLTLNMPSNLRSLFNRKGSGKKGINDPTADDGGSTASHSSNEHYLSSGGGGSGLPLPQQPLPEQQQHRLHMTNISKQGKNCDTRSRDGVPVITSAGADYFTASAVNSKSNYATEGFYSKSKLEFKGGERPKVRPSARTSAFGGAPRYDWMDIVSA